MVLLYRNNATINAHVKTQLTTFRISQQWRIRKTVSVSKRWPGSSKFNHLFNGPLPTLSEKFHANPFGSFCAKLLTDKHTRRQLHILLGGGNNNTNRVNTC